MEHQETRRIVPGAKYAVLFLHGIVGTPNQFRVLMPLESLVPEDWSVFNVRYPGHGGDVRDFGRSRMDQWRAHAREAFLELAENHEKVLVVGHSMGTLFAMQLALEFPEATAGIFLVNLPMRPWVRLRGICYCLRLAFHRIREDHPWEKAFSFACGVTPTAWVWRYIPWIPRVLELFVEIHRTEKEIGSLSVPGIAWQSRKDELVSNLSAPVLRNFGTLTVRELANSGHFYYGPEDIAAVSAEFATWIKKSPHGM